MNAKTIYVVDGARTPFLKAKGRSNPFTASDLAVMAGRALLLRQPFGPEAIDEVILGCVVPAPDEVNIGRMTALRLGIPHETPAWTAQRNCASGLQALDSGLMSIQSGRAGLVLAGGTEAMSRAPFQLRLPMTDWITSLAKTRGAFNLAKHFLHLKAFWLKPVHVLLKGLTDPIVGLTMGQTAEKIVFRFGISRAAMDAFSVRSHHRLAEAQLGGGLDDEIIPLLDRDGGTHAWDTGLRADTDLEHMSRLKPVFDRPVGSVTAGNSAQVTDGACWMLLADRETVERYGLDVLGTISPTHWAGVDPAEMGLGPAHAISGLLEKRNLTFDDIDYWEINEAFAGQVLACREALADSGFCRDELGRNAAWGRIPEERLNVDGGAVSIGHPVGASGARIVLHLLNLLKRNQAKRGIASLCIGGGQGGAVLVERSDGDPS